MSLTKAFEPGPAAAQALRLPLILSEILLQSSFGSGRTLFACSLVNSLWAEEAIRLLWEACGEKHNMSIFPRISHLINIETHRRQKYANCIRKLTIRQHLDDEPWSRFYLRLQLLIDLSFPRLESFQVCPPIDIDKYHYLPLSQYIQPRLRKLVLIASYNTPFVFAENLLQQIQQECPGLRKLSIWEGSVNPLNMKWWISPDRLTSFLQSFESLEEFSTNLTSAISKTSFEALSLCQHLKTVVIKTIPGSWVHGLPSTAFPAIQDLNCTISDHALEALVPVLAPATALELIEEVGSTGIWDLVIKARFEHLCKLDLSLEPSTVLHGTEILLIGLCSQLQILKIQFKWADHSEYAFQTQEFDDETMKKLARQLPMLTELDLRCFSRMTESSLISLGNFCPLLESCYMHAATDWKKVSMNACSQPWSNLKDLCIPDSDRREYKQSPVSRRGRSQKNSKRFSTAYA